ncbi:MAG: response regulator [Bacteroidia bacterium]|nr:response regulator [Bacteroidia bacterium]
MGGGVIWKSNFRILLVEDNVGDVVLFNEALNHLDNVVELKIVKDSLTAIKHLAELPTSDLFPDLILSDINMPGMSGKDLLIALKNDIQFSDIPVIMMSTTSDPTEIKQAFELGARYFAVKRDSVDQIEKLFRKMINLVTLSEKPRSLKDFVL